MNPIPVRSRTVARTGFASPPKATSQIGVLVGRKMKVIARPRICRRSILRALECTASNYPLRPGDEHRECQRDCVEEGAIVLFHLIVVS